jgi:arsenite-transporting ATPase
MSLILTFLGKGGTGRTTLAIATAKAAAQEGRRTLLVGQEEGPALAALLGTDVPSKPQTIGANLSVVQLRSTMLLERNWSIVKDLEAQYVRTPFFKEIYGQELAVLPGMDSALALEELRQFDESGQYDVVVYDGTGNLATLRMFGMPEVASWYQRRASKAFLDSDLFKTLRPFADPILQAVGAANLTVDELTSRIRGEGPNLLERGRLAVADPQRVRAYLVTTGEPAAVETARFLWGSAQTVGLTVGGVLLSPLSHRTLENSPFAPLPIREIPTWKGSDWAPLMDAVHHLLSKPDVPLPVEIDLTARTVRLFIPGFDKSQIELSQSGPEITITAGDQRRNLFLPPGLVGRQVTGARFEDRFLVISFG